jgi:outer membrane biosynthesis protein TonB
MKEQTKIAGSVSNRGISSVNAMGTPLGRYLKKMNDAIGSRWYSSMERKGEMAGVGTVQVHFFIDRRGKVQQLKVTKNTSNETFQDICLGSIYDAHFEPIPEDLAKALPSEGLEMEEFTFILYPN